MAPVHIADIDKGRGEVIRVEITEFKGKNLVNIRTWYTNEAGELAPTKKGVALSKDQFEKLQVALAQVAEKVKDFT